MFPLTDMSGRVIAFSGRVFNENGGKTLGASAQAKYVNSPETEVFQKSRVLFGFAEAKQAMRQTDKAVLVEGQMDLILSHQTGVTSAVASSGTALTSEQLALIKRFTKNIVIAFDGDSAGLAAAHRGVGLALLSGMVVRIAYLPKGQDPADLVLKDPTLWRGAVDNAKHVIDFYLEMLPLEHTDPGTLRAKVSEIIIPFIAELQSPIDQGHYVGQVARLLHIREEPVWNEVKKCGVQGLPSVERKLPETPPLSRKFRIARIIEGALLWQEQEKIPSLKDIATRRARLHELFPPLAVDVKAERPPGETEKIVFEAEIRFQGVEAIDKELDELFQNLEDELIRERLTRKMEELKTAEMRGDIAAAHVVLAECQALSKKLHIKPAV
jgi:DNA primase